jgi:SAM-dependent methyltransferase
LGQVVSIRNVWAMNENHARVCTSPEWAAHLADDVLPWLVQHADLGGEMLEIGPGPGAATRWLRHKVRRLTAVEIDQDAAAKLTAEFAGSNVEIVAGDATGLAWPADSFDSVGCFTMLHHVPTAAAQNMILAEALRVLRPGGVLIASDSLGTADLHEFHAGDSYNPVDPAWLVGRLQSIGFGQVIVMADWMVKFVARKPGKDTWPPADGETQAAP